MIILNHILKSLQLVPLLFQTGYLTIKKILSGRYLELSYPNLEVETAFSENLLNELTDYQVEEAKCRAGS